MLATCPPFNALETCHGRWAYGVDAAFMISWPVLKVATCILQPMPPPNLFPEFSMPAALWKHEVRYRELQGLPGQVAMASCATFHPGRFSNHAPPCTVRVFCQLQPSMAHDLTAFVSALEFLQGSRHQSGRWLV